MTDNPFSVVPPAITLGGKQVQLRPLAPLSWPRIQKARELCDEQGDTAIALGYVALHAVSPATAARWCHNDDAFREVLNGIALEITLEDLQAVADYLSALIERSAQSEVSVEGK